MRKKYNIIVALLSIIILLISIILFSPAIRAYFFTKGEGTIRKELFDFAVEDTASVTKIYMVSMDGKQLTLKKQNPGNWQVNGKFKARNDAVKNLLDCIKNMEVKAPVAKSAIENVSKQLATSATKVEIYQNDKLVKTYYVGGDAQDGLGTFMLLTDAETGENSTMPFLMFIPGFNGFLSIRYFMDEDLWRDRSVFAFYPDQIASISVEYTHLLDSSFTISLTNSNTISLSDSKGNKIPDFDTLKVKQYLNYYSNIQYESLQNGLRPGFKDSVLAKGAVHLITLKDRQGKIHLVKTFSKPIEAGSIDPVTGKPLEEDMERMFALIHEDKDMAIIQYYVFGKLFPTPTYFKKIANTKANPPKQK
ncbi:MAG: hypothetical protein EPN85_13680 [Bacteroidetes bacterium]|nr:MAG: hypothetical protein EPN85_13680 [Bacteroidota bacterium]